MMFAAGAEIPYVMAQVGHGDSKVTLEIYAQVLKRRDREQIGRAFDHLLVGGGGGEPRTPRASRRPISRARRPRDWPQSRLSRSIRAEIGPKTGPKPQNPTAPHPARRCPATTRTPALAGVLAMELGGLEPPTSWVRSRRSPN